MVFGGFSMLTIKILNEAFLEAIKGRWIKSISGVYYLKYIGLVDDLSRRESRETYIERIREEQLYQKYSYFGFYEVYSDYEAYKKLTASLDYSKLINHETVEDSNLLQELENKQKATEEWANTDPEKFIVENLNLLFSNIEIIKGNPRYYYATMPATGFYSTATSFFSRSGQTLIPIGLLLEEWIKGNFIQICSNCGNTSYSLYTSSNDLKYLECEELSLCPSCNSYEKIWTERRAEWMDLREIIRQKKNIIRTYRFDTVVKDLIAISGGTVIKRPNVSFIENRRWKAKISK